MAKKISLQLEINGVKQSVSSIDDLEKSITEMKNQLKGVDIGSKEFDKLSGEIRKAQNFAEDLNESLKPQELEKRVGAYAKVGSAIVSSFAAAQATISLFGEESEDVAKAAAKAQAVLTIALTARQAAEGLVAVKTVAANVATVASAAAANAANVATRALYATIAANPYGAIVVAIGLVVGALIAFTGESEKAVNVSGELSKATSEEANQLRNSVFILTKMNGQRELQNREIEKLKKEYPGFNAFIDKENKLTEKGIRFLELKIKQYELEAKAKLIAQRIAENGIKILEIENTSILDNVSFWEKAFNALKNVGTIDAGLTQEFRIGLENRRKKIEEVRRENEKLAASYENVNVQINEVLTELKPLNQELETQVVNEQKSTKRKEELIAKQKQLNDAYEQGRKAAFNFSKEVQILNEALKKYEEEIVKLGEVEISAKIVDDLKEIQKQRTQLVEDFIPQIKKVEQEYKKLFIPPQDTFFQTFADYVEELENLFSKETDLKKFQTTLENFFKKNKDLTKPQRDEIFRLTAVYKSFTEQFQKFSLFDAFDKDLKGVKNLTFGFREFTKEQLDAMLGLDKMFYLLGDVGVQLGNFTKDVKDGKIIDILPSPQQMKVVEQNSKLFFDTLRKNLYEPAKQEAVKARKESLQASLMIFDEGSTEFQAAKGALDKLNEGIFPPELNEDVKTRVEALVKTITSQLSAVFKSEGGVYSIKQQVEEFTNILIEPPQVIGNQLLAFVRTNLRTISEELFNLNNDVSAEQQKFFEKAKKDETGFQEFVAVLREKYKKIELADIEELRRAYAEYLKFKEEEEEKTKKTRLDILKEELTEIGKYIQTFSTAINQIAALSRESIQNQLDFLQKSTEAQLEQVVGDTESAEKKRTEIREQYNEERKELERQATVQSLRFALAQSIANAAQAITGIYASLSSTGPAALILAGIQSAVIAGITAAEIAIINEQINTAQMFRRGGLLRAQGGMLLSGPTHEQGGIPLAQMGIIAEGQEAIINRNSLINYRDLLSSVNQAGGGRPLVVNSFDDTRIVEAIASQRQKPLRAYVLQSEITNEQALSKRLDDLSKI